MKRKRHFLIRTALALFMVLCSTMGWGQKSYSLVTSTSDLTSGAKYIVASGDIGNVRLLGYQATNNRPQTTSTSTVNGNIITVTPAAVSTNQTSPYEITLNGSTGAWVLYDEANNINLGPASGSNSNNHLKANATATYTISFDNNAAILTAVTSTNTNGRNIIRFNSSSSLFSSYASGQAAVYLFKEIVAAPCNEGTLTAGTTNATATQVLSGGSIDLSLTGTSTGTGLSYQWQSSPDSSSWTNISGATNATYTATNISASTYYRAAVTCGSTTAYSTPVHIIISYCTAGATEQVAEKISNFTFGSINNNSIATTGYEDFTSLSTDAQKGVVLPFSVNVNDPYAQDQILIWVDLNQDYDFDDASERVYTGTISGTYPISGNITIPNTALNGNTRLRIRLFDTESNATANACGDTQYGQVEDYTVNILPSSPTILADGNSLSIFTYVEGNGPSAEQSFTVTGANLSSNITATAPTNWEVSATSGSGFSTTATLPAAGGTVYTRLVSGLAVNPSYSGNIALTSTGATPVDVAVSGSVTAPINAVSNDTNFGTVSVAGNVITAVPAAGYTYADPAYTVVSGTATVSQNGNEFTVNATSATTIQINFVAMPTYTLSLVNDGAAYTDATYPLVTYEGNTVVLPILANCGTSTFVGWDANSATTSAPTYVGGGTYTTTASNVTLYAVYSETATGGTTTSFYGFEDADIGWTSDATKSPLNPKSGTYSGRINTNNVHVTYGTMVPSPSSITFSLMRTSTNSNHNIKVQTSPDNSTWSDVATYLMTEFNNGSYTERTTDLTAFQNVYVRVYYTGTTAVRHIDDVSLIYSGGTVTTYTTSPNCAPAIITWNGSAWSNGTGPAAPDDVVISGNYNGNGFNANNITVSSGAALTIPSGQTIAAANMTVEDNANFIQEDGSTLNLTGTMTLNKNATSDAAKYVFWSSPVQNQNVYNIYPAGTPQFVMTYNSDTDLYPTVANPTIAAAGVGYSVKVPVSATAAQFTGAPNSGDIPVSLDNAANANGNTWNLIGNPYPSNLNLQSLYNGGGIGSSIYFWDNISATNTTQQQAATTWAVYNAANGTWSNTGNAGLGIDGNNNLVKPGQGFIVQATASSITFTNAMRSAATANFINKGMNPGEGKFWLKLATPSGTQFQTAITYGGGALNTLEAFDSKVMSVGANGIYSYLGADKLAIQGRDYFVNTDVVILGNKHSASGHYTFSLAGKTGLFDAGQAIYLKDKQTNIYTNLQTDSYTFLSDALEQQDRFEIVYQPQAALGTAETVKTETVVYKDGDHFTVKASEKILSIEVYDASGRHIGIVKPDSTTAQVTVGSRGMYLLKIKTVNSETVKKVIK